METIWVRIEGFPNYSVSNMGDVVNEETGRLLRLSSATGGAIKVNLFKNGILHTHSVKVLVAEAFVECEFDSDRFNTPIHLDGNYLNNRADNITWRPRNFAWKYTRQFSHLPEYCDVGPIIELDSQIQYFTVYQAAIINGVLIDDIWKSITLVKPEVFPTWQRFWVL